jgi:hypothetical protein
LLSGHTYASAFAAMSGTLLDIFDRPIIYKSVRYIECIAKDKKETTNL